MCWHGGLRVLAGRFDRQNRHFELSRGILTSGRCIVYAMRTFEGATGVSVGVADDYQFCRGRKCDRNDISSGPGARGPVALDQPPVAENVDLELLGDGVGADMHRGRLGGEVLQDKSPLVAGE